VREYFRSIIAGERQGLSAGLWRWIMAALATGYSLAVRAVNWGYSRKILPVRSLPRPVVSVGNITWGGVGKTPLIQFIAAALVERGKKPAVLIRGYMPGANGQLPSDEAILLQSGLPGTAVIAGPDRCGSARKFLRNSDADIFLLDDGFQHRRLKRDLDIVVIDTTNPLGPGGGRVIPAGILREPLSALQRADVFVLTKTDLAADNLSGLKQRLQEINSRAPIMETVHRPAGIMDFSGGRELGLGFLNNKNVACLCGIGDPQGFLKTVRGLGAEVRDSFIFGDHHWYRQDELAAVAARCRREGIDYLVITEKDSVKLQALAGERTADLRILVLKIKIDFRNGKDAFLAGIFSLLEH